MKNTITELSPKTLDVIAESIQTALQRRGFHAAIKLATSIGRDGRLRFDLTSDPFQTVPVLYKTISLINFGGSVTQNKDNEKILDVWLPVSATYDHFDGSGNSCEVMTYFCKIDAETGHVFGETSR